MPLPQRRINRGGKTHRWVRQRVVDGDHLANGMHSFPFQGLHTLNIPFPQLPLHEVNLTQIDSVEVMQPPWPNWTHRYPIFPSVGARLAGPPARAEKISELLGGISHGVRRVYWTLAGKSTVLCEDGDPEVEIRQIMLDILAGEGGGGQEEEQSGNMVELKN